MAWPLTPLTTYVAGSPPAIKAADLVAFQTAINSAYAGTMSMKALTVDGTGGQAVSPTAGSLSVSGNVNVGGTFFSNGVTTRKLWVGAALWVPTSTNWSFSTSLPLGSGTAPFWELTTANAGILWCAVPTTHSAVSPTMLTGVSVDFKILKTDTTTTTVAAGTSALNVTGATGNAYNNVGQSANQGGFVAQTVTLPLGSAGSGGAFGITDVMTLWLAVKSTSTRGSGNDKVYGALVTLTGPAF